MCLCGIRKLDKHKVPEMPGHKSRAEMEKNMAKVVVMDHPLIQHKIGYIRRKQTGTKDFRQTISEIAMLICYEATRDLKLTEVQIETPICEATVMALRGKRWRLSLSCALA